MKERVFAAVREMKREQWLICGLAGLLLLVIAAPVKQKEQKKTQEKTTVSQTQEQTDDQIRQSYEKQLESVLSQVEGVGAVQVAVAMESTGKKQVEKDSPEDTSTSSEKGDSGTQRSSQTVTTGETTVYEDTGDGGQTPYISSSTYPEIRGVIVVAQGGRQPVDRTTDPGGGDSIVSRRSPRNQSVKNEMRPVKMNKKESSSEKNI